MKSKARSKAWLLRTRTSARRGFVLLTIPGYNTGKQREKGIKVVKLYNKDTNEFLGRISAAQFEILASHLELESLNDHDYYITRETLDLVEQSGADRAVVDLLRAAMKPRESIEIRWEKEQVP